MSTSEIDITATTAIADVAEPAPPKPKQNKTPNRTADKRADALRAKKKKKRAAHRVALRRSHSNG